jgi:hypothetical protein
MQALTAGVDMMPFWPTMTCSSMRQQLDRNQCEQVSFTLRSPFAAHILMITWIASLFQKRPSPPMQIAALGWRRSCSGRQLKRP